VDAAAVQSAERRPGERLMWAPIDDLPAATPRFDFERLARTLAAGLQQKRSAAFVLGLHGPWGAGKTTLLEAIRRQLSGPRVVVDFNAWKYQDKEALWRALILRVLAAIRDEGHGDGKIESKVAELEHSLYEGFSVSEQGSIQVNWTAATAVGIQAAIGLAAMGIGGGVLAGAAGLLKNLFGQKKEGDGKAEDTAKQVERAASIIHRQMVERAVRHVVSIEQFLDLFRQLVQDLGTEKRVYVLIDDLDRCLPETALGIFEAVKLFLDSGQCAYVVAVDRAVIRRGLELRYPARSLGEGRTLPPVVDPDEYIEKTITLSLDLPMLADEDGRELLTPQGAEELLSSDERTAIVAVLGTNPRRLKRFGAMLALWFEVARALRDDDQRALGFSPTEPGARGLFIKLSLIGYLSSAVLAEMRRDPGLAGRLQGVCNAMFDDDRLKPGAAQQITQSMAGELPVVAQASLDPALWRALLSPPNLTTATQLPAALRWFRSAAGK
jgi:hypothetical protein